MTSASNIGNVSRTGCLRLGSLSTHISAPRSVYLEDLSEIYSVPLLDGDKLEFIRLHLEIVEAPGSPSVEVPPDGLVITPDGELHTETMFAQTSLGDRVPRIRITVLNPDLRKDQRHMYLVVLLNKVFFWMGYTRLHACAVSFDGKANAFIGDRGAGKSSICAYLAGRGGLVLADDDVMLRLDGSRCSVSGCDETMRIMPDTEKHLFGHLDALTEEFGGVLKKEIATADRFAIDPYVDYRLDRIFFPRVGDAFTVKRMPSSLLVMRLMSTLVRTNRFSGADDHANTLGYLTEVADRVNSYELILSRDFNGLDQLFDFLGNATD